VITSIKQEIDYKTTQLAPFFSTKHQWLFAKKDIISAFNATLLQLDNIIKENKQVFEENKHFITQDNEQLWTKKGIIKLAFFLGTTDAIDFIEFIDSLKSPKTQSIDTQTLSSIYKEIEKKMLTMVQDDNTQTSSEDMNNMMKTFNQLILAHQDLVKNENISRYSNEPLNNNFQNAYNIADKTSSMAHQFATDTMNTASAFATKTEDDAFNFTSKTENDAYNFASKTEDDAFKFTSKMADDAYKFTDKMAENAYKFADKGMDYGYMFASQGEELGPMADRILWMASEIGLMSDRIGEMADRIVHTEHLIINMSVNILNFGLLIDSTIKTIAEAGLNAFAVSLDQEAPKLESSNKNLDIIAQNVQLILKQQHEYDLAVLENQLKLREKTLSALDYIKYEY